MKTKLILKIVLVLGVFLFTSSFSHGQEIDKNFVLTPQEMHDMFMQKHKSKTTAGWITLGSGLVLAGVGFAIYDESGYSFGVPSEQNILSVTLVVIGGASTLVSVPFFISAGSNKRKAELALKREFVGVETINKSDIYGLSITISF